ncbi:hypothetical protein O3G_MSEX000158 [Manduca sexta]|nr:hypothetical protein O3G_MSEX000158 [Manduca sexta]
MINKYRPSYIISSPTMLTTLIKPIDRDSCDFSCFETILVGGGAVPDNLIEDAKKCMPNVDIEQGYGMSEVTTLVFLNIGHAPGSCGKPHGLFQYKLVDPITGEEINVPNKPGELWIQSEVIFSGYYNDPKATAEIYEDGWLKSGDIFYRDENWNFFFVDRLKLLLKYKNHQVSPVDWKV